MTKQLRVYKVTIDMVDISQPNSEKYQITLAPTKVSMSGELYPHHVRLANLIISYLKKTEGFKPIPGFD